MQIADLQFIKNKFINLYLLQNEYNILPIKILTIYNLYIVPSPEKPFGHNIFFWASNYTIN